MATTKLWTVEELEQTSLDGRCELIDGDLIEMSPSGCDASNVASIINFHFTAHVRPRGLGKVYYADGRFVLFPNRRCVRVPDVAFVRGERLPTMKEQRGFLRLAPDIAVEVVSPTDRMIKVLDKVAEYLRAGVRLV